MTFGLKDHVGIDFSTVDHHRKTAKRPLVITTHDGDCLSGFDALPHSYEILSISGVDGFKSVVVANDDHVTL